jgi:hypothetical protein
MKKALIDSKDNRVLQVVDEEFEVHGSLFWVDCPDDTGTYYIYDPEELTFEDPHAHTKDEFGNPVEPFVMQRTRAYPPMGEQLDLLFKEIRDTGSISTDGAWFQSIQAVKEAVPKPASPTDLTQHLNSDGSVATFYEDVTGTTSGVGRNATFKFRNGETLQAAVTSPGLGYAINDTITVVGSSVGASGSVVLTVNSVDPAGGISSVSIN